MRAGTAIREITPKGPVMLCGYPESAMSTGVHDPLFISAYYLTDGKTKALYLTADLCFFAKPRIFNIIRDISEATGVPETNVLMAATHTHYGPAPDCDIYNEILGPELHPEYMDFVQAQAVEAAKEAVQGAFEAKLAYGRGYCGKEQGIGGNRHDPDKYCQDPDVLVLAISDEKDNVRGILLNYALHPTVMTPYTTEVTADYVGYLRTTVMKAYPGAVFGFMQGCSGNQSSRYFRKNQTMAEVERFGVTIGAEVVRVMGTLEFKPVDGPLYVEQTKYCPSNMRKIPSMEEAVAAADKTRADYKKMVEEHAPEAERRSMECTKIGKELVEMYARSVEKLGLEAVMSLPTPIDVHYLVVGDVAIAANSAEVFADVGLAVKKASPFAMTMMSCLTGPTTHNYVCAKYSYDAMYYEPSGSMYGCGTAEEMAEVFSNRLAELHKELAKGGK